MPEPDPAPAAATTARPAKPSKRPVKIEIKVSWCKGCGLCVDYCNRDVLEMQGPLPRVIHAEKCSRCLQCEVICPDFAITIGDADPQPETGDGGGA